MAEQTAAEILIDTVHEWGVDTIFGIPGDGINGIMEALRTRQDKIRFVQVRHEEAAAFMATGYAKWTGKIGCCFATSGPGGIQLLNGLYDAKLDGVPVLAITGMQFHDLLHTHTQQDVELDKLFENVSVYNSRIMGPAHVENVATLACRTALAYCGVSHVTMPVDLQDQTFSREETSKLTVAGHTSDVFADFSGLPSEEALDHAAAVLNDGRKTVILAGRGAIGASDELEQVADLRSAIIAKALLGKMAVPDESPYTTGPIGLEGSEDYLIQSIKNRGMYLDELAQLPEGGGFLIVEFGAVTSEEAARKAEHVCDVLSSREDAPSIAVFTEPAGPYEIRIPARRTRHVRFNDLRSPEPVPRETDFASLIESDVPIVVQHTRLDSRQSALALLSIMAFAGS